MVNLWIIIRDFFVIYIFGGTDSNGEWYDLSGGTMKVFVDGVLDDTWNGCTSELWYKVGHLFPTDIVGDVYISLSDWLSTTATIITLCALVIGISALMISLFKWIVRLVSLRG